MKPDRNAKNARNARLLVAAFWLYRVMSGHSIVKTTLQVADRERRSIRDLRLRESGADAETLKKSKKAKASGMLVELAADVFWKGLRSYLKKQKVF